MYLYIVYCMRIKELLRTDSTKAAARELFRSAFQAELFESGKNRDDEMKFVSSLKRSIKQQSKRFRHEKYRGAVSLFVQLTELVGGGELFVDAGAEESQEWAECVSRAASNTLSDEPDEAFRVFLARVTHKFTVMPVGELNKKLLRPMLEQHAKWLRETADKAVWRIPEAVVKRAPPWLRSFLCNPDETSMEHRFMYDFQAEQFARECGRNKDSLGYTAKVIWGGSVVVRKISANGGSGVCERNAAANHDELARVERLLSTV